MQGVENAKRKDAGSKMHGLKMQEWKMRDQQRWKMRNRP